MLCPLHRFEAQMAKTADSGRSNGSSRKRGASPRHPRSHSPRRRRSRSPARYKDKGSASTGSLVFGSGASSSGFSACAVCLRRSKHAVRECQLPHTWDDTHSMFATCKKGKLVRRSDSSALCYEWQRASSCRSRSHDDNHICSRCGDSKHGAFDCPRAQRA